MITYEEIQEKANKYSELEDAPTTSSNDRVYYRGKHEACSLLLNEIDFSNKTLTKELIQEHKQMWEKGLKEAMRSPDPDWYTYNEGGLHEIKQIAKESK